MYGVGWTRLPFASRSVDRTSFGVPNGVAFGFGVSANANDGVPNSTASEARPPNIARRLIWVCNPETAGKGVVERPNMMEEPFRGEVMTGSLGRPTLTPLQAGGAAA